MPDPTWAEGVPRKILLATDLSARCDRALERAVSLAAGWRAQLIILHVFEDTPDPAAAAAPAPSWQRPPDAAAVAKARIRQGLRAEVGDAVDRASVLVEEGDPAQVIEETALAQGCELIVTGIASERPFGRQPVVLGKTVERLLRRAAVPVLIVRNRAQAAYEHILVATDLSEVSGHALQAALRFFPFQSLHLLYSHEDSGKEPAGELDAFLDAIFMPAEQRQRLRTLTEHGRPADLVCDYVRAHHADLVVMGTRGRGAVMEALIGSTAKNILSALPCDALVVRQPLARGPG